MQLDLNLLTALDALLEEESVTGAADRLHVSAPAMSRTLGRIRLATGDQILTRTGRFMKPTPRALALREEVRSLVMRSADVLAPEQDLHLDTLLRTFTVRAHDALTTALAPILLRQLAGTAPGVQMRFLAESSGESTDLRRGIIDLEIGSNTAPSPDIVTDHVGADRLVGIARTEHPELVHLAPGERLELSTWLSVPHVVVSRRGRLRDPVDDQLEAMGLSRRVAASTASTGAAVAIIRTTDTIATVPATVARRLEAGVTSFTLPIELPPVPIVLAWHRQFTTDQGHHWLRTTVRNILESEHRLGRIELERSPNEVNDCRDQRFTPSHL